MASLSSSSSGPMGFVGVRGSSSLEMGSSSSREGWSDSSPCVGELLLLKIP